MIKCPRVVKAEAGLGAVVNQATGCHLALDLSLFCHRICCTNSKVLLGVAIRIYLATKKDLTQLEKGRQKAHIPKVVQSMPAYHERRRTTENMEK